MADADDRADVDASRRGDAQAYARIVERYQDKLAARLGRFARRPDLDELVQDVFVEAYFSLRTFRGDAPFEHWLNRIATRVGYRYWKKRRAAHGRALEPIDAHQLATATDSANGALDAQAALQLLHGLLDRLGPRDRLAITLLHLEQRSVAEAAELTGWSKTMVKVQAFRARAKLRKLLAQHGVTSAG